MDRQRNDRLGRLERFGSFEHRWEILRTVRFANTHTDANGDSYFYSNTYAYTDRLHGAMFTYAATAPDSEAAAYSAASPNTGAASAFAAPHSGAATHSTSST